MNNKRRRKDAKEYARGFAAGEEARIRQPNESRRGGEAYSEGYNAGSRLRRERMIEEGQVPDVV